MCRPVNACWIAGVRPWGLGRNNLECSWRGRSVTGHKPRSRSLPLDCERIVGHPEVGSGARTRGQLRPAMRISGFPKMGTRSGWPPAVPV